MSTEVKVGSRIIGTVVQEEDDTWTYHANYMGDQLNATMPGFSCKDAAVSQLRAFYRMYLKQAADLPPDLNWHSIPGVRGREFLTRPNYTKDSIVYGQRKALKLEPEA